MKITPRIDSIPAAANGQRLRPRLLSALIHCALTMAPAAALAQESAKVEFDPSFLPSGSSGIVDISRFADGNIVLPGVHGVDVAVNGTWLGREELTFKRVGDEDSARLCLSRDLLQSFGIDLERAASALERQGETDAQVPDELFCESIGRYVPGATATFDSGEQSLAVSVPQIYINRQARGYVSPRQWDGGVNAATLAYRFNHTQARYGGRNGNSSFLGLNAGLNLGLWHLRHDGAYSANNGGNAGYQSTATYVQRELPSLQSQLILGDTYTSGALFESMRVRGVHLATDDRMLPNSLTGYAPSIRGIAETNARVSIRQRGTLIYDTTVAPGPFELNDLYATGYGGDLDVTITEADGRERQFTVPYAAVPKLLRAGYSRYSLTVGELNDPNLLRKPTVAQATFQRGLADILTGYVGMTVSDHYRSGLAGAALNTSLGAISLDGTVASTRLPGWEDSNGYSVQARYNKNLIDSGTNFSLGAYRYSTDGYLSVSDAARLRDRIDQGLGIEGFLRPRSRLDVNINQNLGHSNGILSLTGSMHRNWGQDGHRLSYSASYSNVWRTTNYSIGLQRSRVLDDASLTGNQREDTTAYVYLSMPLGRRDTRRPSLSLTGSHNRQGTQGNAGISGTLGEHQQLSYGASLGRSVDGDISSNLNADYHGPFASVGASHSRGAGYNATSVGATGGIVAHPGGITFGQTLGETIGIVRAEGATDAMLTNVTNGKVDSRGYAIVPYLVPYRLNTVDLDPMGTSLDVELKSTSQRVAPRLGAVVMFDYEAQSGRMLMINAQREDGTPLPFAADVFDEQDNRVGVVGQGSRLFVRGVADSGALTVRWGEGPEANCRIAYVMPALDEKAGGMSAIDGRCSAP